MMKMNAVMMPGGLLLILLVLATLILLTLILLLLCRRSGKSPAPPQSCGAQPAPPPSLGQRQAGLERSHSRYREERARILGMVENCRVTPEEAERLFTTLDRETSTMACPYCSGDVRIEALICKHCHRDLMADMGRRRRLCKSRARVLAGVCGGVAEYSGLDVSLLRLLVVLATLLTSIIPGLLIYLVAAMVIPEPD